jgi:thioredoxin 1
VTQVFYFTADWCGPCKKVRPIVEELNRDQADVKFQIIDVDSEGELTRKFEVKSIPTFIRIEDNKEVKRVTGAQTRSDLEKFIK